MTARPCLAPFVWILIALAGVAATATTAQAASAKCMGKKATIVGTNKADRIVGTAKRDVIVARGGNDRIFGRGGNDIICAGKGQDTVKGERGNDRISGGPGRDTLRGGAGKDLLAGNAGTDRLFGGTGRDRLLGGTGRDIANGGSGNDIIDGGRGKGDLAVGGKGRDTCRAERRRGCERGAATPSGNGSGGPILGPVPGSPGPTTNRILVTTAAADQVTPGAIFSMTTTGGDVRELSAGTAEHLRVSPEGRRIVYNAAGRIMIANADGSGSRALTEPPAGGQQFTPDWSPDGRKVIFGQRAQDKSFTLQVWDLKTGRSTAWRTPDVTALSNTDYFIRSLDWVPEGVFLEYAYQPLILCATRPTGSPGEGERCDPQFTAVLPTDLSQKVVLLPERVGGIRLAPFTVVKNGKTIRPIAFSKIYGFSLGSPDAPPPAGARLAAIGAEWSSSAFPSIPETRHFKTPAFNPARKGIAFAGGGATVEDANLRLYVLDIAFSKSQAIPPTGATAIWTPPAGTLISGIEWAKVSG